MINSEMLEKAEALGLQAAIENRISASACDPEFCKLLPGLKVGESLTLLDAWILGYMKHCNNEAQKILDLLYEVGLLGTQK